MSLDALETLSKFTSPLLIPLPPSPPPKVSIASRKPEGWVSVVPRLSSGRFVSSSTDLRVVSDGQREGGEEGSGNWGYYGEDENHRPLTNPMSSLGRAPLGRVSSLARGRRDISSTRGRGSPSARGRGGKRVVSGTMQYALLPPSPPPPLHPHQPSSSRHIPSSLQQASFRPAPSDADTHSRTSSTGSHLPAPPSTASPRSDALQTFLSGVDFHIPSSTTPRAPALTPDLPGEDDGDDTAVYHLEEGDNDTSFRSVSEAGSVPDTGGYEVEGGDEGGEGEGDEGEDGWVGEVLAEREADEEWMSHVRTQLNALFPDFFTGDQHDSNPLLHSSHSDHSTSSQPQSFQQVESAQRAEWDHGLDPVAAGRQAVDALPLPGMRIELGDLREEIERLRGVVGELAQGLTTARAPAGRLGGKTVKAQTSGEVVGSGVKLETDAEELEVEGLMALELGDGTEKSDVGRELVGKNADQIIHLLRTLDDRMNPRQGGPKAIEALLGSGNLAEMIRRNAGTSAT